MIDRGYLSHERLTHFHCHACTRWWTIADVPTDPMTRQWWCPWCGAKQQCDDKTPKSLS